MRCEKCDTEPLSKLETPLQGLYCIDCVSYCPYCEVIIPQWVLDCNEGYCMNCAVGAYSKSRGK